MAKFTNLEAAFQHVSDQRKLDTDCGDPQRLWSILVGPSLTHYVYFSDRNHGQQMHNIGKTILEFAGLYGTGQRAGRELAKDLGDMFKAQADEEGLVRFGGHSEESMIKDFPKVLANEIKLEPKGVGMVILNSDSPCTTQDRGGSNNLPGWPASCMAKLVTLANQNPKFEFTVFFLRRYGKLDEGARAAREKAKTQLGKSAKKDAVEGLAETFRNNNVKAHLDGVMRLIGERAERDEGDGKPQGQITIEPFNPRLSMIAKEFTNI
jgi:hypothetical protein